MLGELQLPYQFLRIQSTACEQQLYDALLESLDANLLMSLALGRQCLVWDLGSRNKKRAAPRAIWYGLEFVKYTLYRIWFRTEYLPWLRGHNSIREFNQAYEDKVSQGTKNRLRYYSRWIRPGLDTVPLYGVYKATTHDRDLEYHQSIVNNPSMVDKPWAQPVVAGSMPAAGGDSLLEGYDQLLAHGYELYMGGLTHQQFTTMRNLGLPVKF